MLRSVSRLREKQRVYLDSFFSEYGHREWGTPKAGKMKIYMSVPPQSSVEALEIIESFRREAGERGVDVIVSNPT